MINRFLAAIFDEGLDVFDLSHLSHLLDLSRLELFREISFSPQDWCSDKFIQVYFSSIKSINARGKDDLGLF